MDTWFESARFGLFVHWGAYSTRGWEPSWPMVGGSAAFPFGQDVPADQYRRLLRRVRPTRRRRPGLGGARPPGRHAVRGAHHQAPRRLHPVPHPPQPRRRAPHAPRSGPGAGVRRRLPGRGPAGRLLLLAVGLEPSRLPGLRRRAAALPVPGLPPARARGVAPVRHRPAGPAHAAALGLRHHRRAVVRRRVGALGRRVGDAGAGGAHLRAPARHPPQRPPARRARATPPPSRCCPPRRPTGPGRPASR